jgi:hypothetical protein
MVNRLSSLSTILGCIAGSSFSSDVLDESVGQVTLDESGGPISFMGTP